MLNILKMLGFDIPAQINALKADLDQRAERTTSQISVVAQRAAVSGALYLLALIAASFAVGVALIAIFWWVTNSYGVFVGLAAEFAIFVLAAAILAMMAHARGKTLAEAAAKTPRAIFDPTSATSSIGVFRRAPAVASPAEGVAPPIAALVSPAATAAPGGQGAAVSDLIEPLAALLSRGGGKPMAAELLGSFAGTEAGPAKTAIDRAANVIRTGDRANLFTVLAGAAVVGWLLTRRSGQR
jgi:hypothetical protein